MELAFQFLRGDPLQRCNCRHQRLMAQEPQKGTDHPGKRVTTGYRVFVKRGNPELYFD